MISKALNSNNDIFFSNGNIQLISDAEYVAQNVKQRLQFISGEWFLDTNAGVPYFESIFVKPVDLTTIQSILKSEILNTPEVKSLTSFQMSYDENTRELLVNFEADTEYGSISANDFFVNL